MPGHKNEAGLKFSTRWSRIRHRLLAASNLFQKNQQHYAVTWSRLIAPAYIAPVNITRSRKMLQSQVWPPKISVTRTSYASEASRMTAQALRENHCVLVNVCATICPSLSVMQLPFLVAIYNYGISPFPGLRDGRTCDTTPDESTRVSVASKRVK